MESRCTTGPGRPAKLTVLLLLLAEHRLQEGGAWCSGATRATHSYTLHPDNTLQLPQPTLSCLHF